MLNQDALEEVKKLIDVPRTATALHNLLDVDGLQLTDYMALQDAEKVVSLLPQLLAEVDRYQRWLFQYAQHAPTCDVFGPNERPCSCGLAELLPAPFPPPVMHSGEPRSSGEVSLSSDSS